ncbi:MAG: rod-determining factor RdfA [Haloferacaceae archaeon]
MSDEADDERPPPRGKVERVIRQYDLPDLGDTLVERWQADDDRSASLRELETEFNVAVLEARMETAGLSPLESECRNLYRLLTDDDVSSGVRTRAVRRLQRADIDVDELRSDFVSHQAIHTYLTKHRNVTDGGDTSRVSPDDVADTVRRLVGRTRAVTRGSIERLRAADRIAVGEFDVTVDVRVYCADCGSTSGLATFLSEGGCQCEPQSETASGP